MCGIVGVTVVDEGLVRRMASAIAHRGPDADGVWSASNAPLTFGHRRLSILDLSERGTQPMAYRAGERELVITFNGEIYNFQQLRAELEALRYDFRTGTDTEVILAAYAEWGTTCVDRFKGMWAFAIWDPSKRVVFLSRDRFGKKPLYLYQRQDQLYFASEIKALLVCAEIPRRANLATTADYLLRGMVNHTADTFFEGIRSLPAGFNATFAIDTKQLQQWQYYRPQPSERGVSDAELAASLRTSVERRLVSDVPISISLSGGIDSSSIAALLSQLSTGSIAAFTTTAPAGGLGDETALVKKLIERYPRYELHERPLDQARFLREYEKIIYHTEEPLWEDAQYVRWEIASAVHAAGYKVLITGEGADEILGGYWPAGAFYARDLFRRRDFRTLVPELIGLTKQHDWALSLAGFVAMGLGSEQLAYRATDRLAKALGIALTPVHREMCEPANDGSLKDYFLWAIYTFSLPQLLMCNDKMSMAHSIESRAPFLDVDFVETALSIESSQFIHDGMRKYPLRRAMHADVPAEILYRRKKDSFGSPMKQFFSTPQIRETFNRYFDTPRIAPIVDHKRVIAHVQKHGIADELTSRLFMLESWARVFDVSFTR